MCRENESQTNGGISLTHKVRENRICAHTTAAIAFILFGGLLLRFKSNGNIEIGCKQNGTYKVRAHTARSNAKVTESANETAHRIKNSNNSIECEIAATAGH